MMARARNTIMLHRILNSKRTAETSYFRENIYRKKKLKIVKKKARSNLHL
jgi:hypothetical protein